MTYFFAAFFFLNFISFIKCTKPAIECKMLPLIVGEPMITALDLNTSVIMSFLSVLDMIP